MRAKWNRVLRGRKEGAADGPGGEEVSQEELDMPFSLIPGRGKCRCLT